MSEFPRTMVGGISMPRLICGSNWLLGYSHMTQAKDRMLKEMFDTPSKIAKVIEVFARAGCNAFMSMATEFIAQALKEVEQRVGVPMIWITTPGYVNPTNIDNSFDANATSDTWKLAADHAKSLGGTFCFPHESVTNPRVDRVNKCLTPDLMNHLRYVREIGMIPGLSTHMPDAIICADLCGADVESYVQPYNSMGFLCQYETDWVLRIINGAKKPVMVIKPMAGGRLMPATGLPFVWNTIRDCDMVTIGTMSTYEAEEVIEMSLACLERRRAEVELQFTRSKRHLIND